MRRILIAHENHSHLGLRGATELHYRFETGGGGGRRSPSRLASHYTYWIFYAEPKKQHANVSLRIPANSLSENFG